MIHKYPKKEQSKIRADFHIPFFFASLERAERVAVHSTILPLIIIVVVPSGTEVEEMADGVYIRHRSFGVRRLPKAHFSYSN
jgi:hypothetical protein